jgi:hypothetical protein
MLAGLIRDEERTSGRGDSRPRAIFPCSGRLFCYNHKETQERTSS